MMLTPAAAEIAGRAMERSRVEGYCRDDALLDNDGPLALRVRVPYARPLCRNNRCDHSDTHHIHLRAADGHPSRWACEVCHVTGGPCQ